MKVRGAAFTSTATAGATSVSSKILATYDLLILHSFHQSCVREPSLEVLIYPNLVSTISLARCSFPGAEFATKVEYETERDMYIDPYVEVLVVVIKKLQHRPVVRCVDN